MGLITEKYPALVVSSDDPEQRGRIRVSCTGLLGDDDAELPMWVEPKLPWGWFLIPDAGEQIEIEVVTESNEDESYGQSSIDHPDPMWTSVRYVGGEETSAPAPVHEFFKQAYGKRRGFATPHGHVLVFDDTAGAASVAIHYAVTKGATADAGLHSIIMDKDGIRQTIQGKHSINIKASGEAEVLIDTGAALKVVGKDGDAVTTLGDGAVKATIADHLETLYGQLKTYIENAKVPTSMGPSGTILAGSGPAPSWDPNINSNKLKFPDG